MRGTTEVLVHPGYVSSPPMPFRSEQAMADELERVLDWPWTDRVHVRTECGQSFYVRAKEGFGGLL